MKMEDWINERMGKFKSTFGDRLHGYELEWIAEMLESAWSRGNRVGQYEAFETYSKWRNEDKI